MGDIDSVGKEKIKFTCNDVDSEESSSRHGAEIKDLESRVRELEKPDSLKIAIQNIAYHVQMDLEEAGGWLYAFLDEVGGQKDDLTLKEACRKFQENGLEDPEQFLAGISDGAYEIYNDLGYADLQTRFERLEEKLLEPA